MKKIIITAMYLYNQTFYASNNSKLLYESFYIYIFYKKEVSRLRKPQLHYLRAYKCKTYMLIKSQTHFQYCQKLQRLDFKAYMSFFIGYKLTNIYQI